MLKNKFWISSRFIKEILLVCGNSSPTENQCEFMKNLLSHVYVKNSPANIYLLSERERTCLFWLAHGKSVEEIAPLMQIKACTVQTYRRRILTKLDCHTLAQAVFLAMCYRPIPHSHTRDNFLNSTEIMEK